MENSETKKIEGEWWLPEKPENKSRGVLNIARDKILLRLEKPIADSSRRFLRAKSILGVELESEEKITLWKNSFAFGTQAMSIYAFLGAHLEKPEFKKITATISHLEKWFPCFPLAEEPKKDKGGFPKILKLKPLRRFIKCQIENGVALSVGLFGNMNEAFYEGTVQIKYKPSVKIEFSNSVSIQDILENYLLHLVNFFSLVLRGDLIGVCVKNAMV